MRCDVRARSRKPNPSNAFPSSLPHLVHIIRAAHPRFRHGAHHRGARRYRQRLLRRPRRTGACLSGLLFPLTWRLPPANSPSSPQQKAAQNALNQVGSHPHSRPNLPVDRQRISTDDSITVQRGSRRLVDGRQDPVRCEASPDKMCVQCAGAGGGGLSRLGGGANVVADLGLQVLDNVIMTRWKVLPREQCQGWYPSLLGILVISLLTAFQVSETSSSSSSSSARAPKRRCGPNGPSSTS